MRGGVQHNFSMGRDLNEMVKEAAEASSITPCVFLSHKSEDNDAVKDIAKYFSDAGIDYYLDVDDVNLQTAVKNNDHKKISEFIELGINNSTHVLPIVSEETKSSWWVPFEIGFAKKGEKNLALLLLKEVPHVPSYLTIIPKLSSIKQLNEYIDSIKASKRSNTKSAADEIIEAIRGQIRHCSNVNHPLTKHLKQH